MDFWIYLGIGTVTGCLSGLLGIGGGLIVVPSLAWAYAHEGFHQNLIMHMAVGTSLAAMFVTTLFSLHAHLRHKTEIGWILQWLLPGIALGTISGAILADFLQSHILRLLFGALSLVVALHMLTAGQPNPQRILPRAIWLLAFAFGNGVMSGLLGIGGSVFMIPFLIHHNISVPNTLVVSMACGVLIAAIGSVSFMITGNNEPGLPVWSTGYVYWPGVLGIVMVSPLFVSVGAYFSRRLPSAVLKRLFGIFLVVVGIHMLMP